MVDLAFKVSTNAEILRQVQFDNKFYDKVLAKKFAQKCLGC